jgi:hypothetical protein
MRHHHLRARLACLIAAAAAGCTTVEIDSVERAAAATPGTQPKQEDWDGARWTDGVVNYVIDRNGNWPEENNPCRNDGLVMTDGTFEAIKQGIAELEALTPVRFVRYTRSNPPPDDVPYVIYRTNDGSGGSSAEIRGMPFGNRPNCVYIVPHDAADVDARRSVLHETGHMLGMPHEQQRPDRDSYIDFDGFCVENDGEGKLFSIDWDALLLSPYDVRSIMHYQSDNSCSETKAGCRDAEGDCIRPTLLRNTDPACTPQCWPDCADGVLDCRWILRPKELSVHDVNALTRMYERRLGKDEPGDGLGEAIAVGDFDDDGYDDVAVGAPGEDPRGAVFLWKGTGGPFPGSLARLVAWKVLRPGDAGSSGPAFSAGRFGAALAVGDFDDDGADDLAVGAPAEDGGALDDGSVFVYPSRTVVNSPRRTLAAPLVYNRLRLFGSAGDRNDRFGGALAAGDFDGDGLDDLAIGVPRRRVGGTRCGEVVVLFGPRREPVVLTPGEGCVAGARFGAALAAGNLDPDRNRRLELAVGSPATATDPALPGAVHLFAVGGRGVFSQAQVLRPRTTAPIRFGAAIAIGNFDGSRTGEGKREPQLAIGAPDHDHVVVADAVSAVVPEAGAVFLYRPLSATSIDYTAVLRVDPPSPGPGHHLGGVLAVWRPAASDPDSLVAGMPDAGASGPMAGPGAVERYSWTSLTPGGQSVERIPGAPAALAGARFGAALAAGDFLSDLFFQAGSAELAVGAPGLLAGAGALDIYNDDFTPTPWTELLQSSASPE